MLELIWLNFRRKYNVSHYDLGLGISFLDVALKAQESEEKIGKLDVIKI